VPSRRIDSSELCTGRVKPDGDTPAFTCECLGGLGRELLRWI